MITFNELLSNNFISDVPISHQQNLEELLKRVNIVREAWGQPMTVTSGYRTRQHHLDIYASKGIIPPHVPMQSKHLYGQAVDIADGSNKLKEWCIVNQELLRSTGLWMESFEHTPTWCHFQCVPYGSYKEGGSLWFAP